jgi:hypothetical protein
MTAANAGGARPRARSLTFPQLLDRQHGVFCLDQAERYGLSMSTVRYRIRPGGPWQRILPGVYLTFSGTPTRDQLDMSALLYVGHGAALTGLAALRRMGVRAQSQTAIDVLVPAAYGRASLDYVRVRRTKQFPALVLVQAEIQFVMVPRAVVDATQYMTDIKDVRAVVAAAVQQGRCTTRELQGEIATRRLRDGGRLRKVLAEVTAGVRSSPEADLMHLIKRAGLPQPLFNPRLFINGQYLARPDAWWPEVGVAVEVDSREWHLSPEDWQATMERHARMAAAGIRVLHFSPHQIRTQPQMVVAVIRQALQVSSPAPGVTTRSAAD